MKFKLATLLLLATALPLAAQAPKAESPQAKAQVAGDPATGCSLPLDLCESAWTVAVFGQYSTINNAPTNNGFMTGGALNFNKNWSAELRYYNTISPNGSILLPGASYRFSAAHLFPSGSGSATFDPQYLELFVHGGAGLGWSSGTDSSGNPVSGAKKFAADVGGGADYTFAAAPNVQIRVIDVSYVYSPLFPNRGAFLGNHVAVTSGLKIVFGGNASPASLRRANILRRKAGVQ